MALGEVALVIVTAGLQAGAIDDSIFSASVAMALVNTILTPMALKVAFARERQATRVPEKIELALADAV